MYVGKQQGYGAWDCVNCTIYTALQQVGPLYIQPNSQRVDWNRGNGKRRNGKRGTNVGYWKTRERKTRDNNYGPSVVPKM